MTGANAFETLQRTLTNDLSKIEPLRCQYTHLLNEDGGVADDIIVWWRGPELFDVMPNASNTDGVTAALTGAGCVAEDVTATRGLIAVQGPTARAMTADLLPEASAVGRNRIVEFTFDGAPCVAAGTGYTGEDGFEIAVPAERANDLWRAITSVGVEPAGLGARDTLRLEAGLPLHGHELSESLSPLNANLSWVIGWDKPEFVGKSALEKQRDAGVSPVLVGLKTGSRRPPREGQTLLKDGIEVGRVSSGNFSPMLEVGIALGFVDVPTKPGDSIQIVGRGAPTEALVVELPFVSK